MIQNGLLRVFGQSCSSPELTDLESPKESTIQLTRESENCNDANSQSMETDQHASPKLQRDLQAPTQESEMEIIDLDSEDDLVTQADDELLHDESHATVLMLRTSLIYTIYIFFFLHFLNQGILSLKQIWNKSYLFSF